MITKLKSFIKNPEFMRYFKNTSWLFGERILRMVIGLFIGVWVAKYLGPKQFGVLSYIQNFVALFSIIATLGLDHILVRELVNNPEKEKELLGTTFMLKIIGSFIMFIIIAIAINFTSNTSYENLLTFIIASTTIFQSFNVIDFYFQSKVLSKYVVFANVFSLIISSFIKIILIKTVSPLYFFVIAILFDSFILSCAYIYWYLKVKKTFFLKNIKFNISISKELLKDSWPLIFSGMVIAIYMKIDQIMISEMIDKKAVGIYAVAVKLSELWYFIPLAIVNSLFPAIANAKKKGEQFYLNSLQKLYDFMVWTAIIIALPMTFLSEKIILLLYGSAYVKAGEVLMIHIWTSVFVFLGVVFTRHLLIENFTKKTLYRTVLGAVINVILNYYLIPLYGIKGAAVATLIGQFSANYLYDFFDVDLHQQLKMKTKSFFPLHRIKFVIKTIKQ